MAQDKIVYLNGEFVSDSEAKITPFDMGFMFGAGIYEVTYIYEKSLFAWDLHTERLYKSAALIGVDVPVSREQILKDTEELIAKNSSWFSTGIVYAQLTLGGQVGYRSNVLPLTTSLKPTLFMFLQSFGPGPVNGIKVKTVEDKRWRMCQIKGCSLLANVLAGLEAKKSEFDEAILYDAEKNIVFEGSNTNAFFIKDGTLYTYPIKNVEDRILHGITRHIIVYELAQQLGIPVKETLFSMEELKSADEVFISSTTREVCPVKMIDDQEVKSCPGPYSIKLQKAFMDKVEKECSVKHPKRSYEFLN